MKPSSAGRLAQCRREAAGRPHSRPCLHGCSGVFQESETAPCGWSVAVRSVSYNGQKTNHQWTEMAIGHFDALHLEALSAFRGRAVVSREPRSDARVAIGRHWPMEDLRAGHGVVGFSCVHARVHSVRVSAARVLGGTSDRTLLHSVQLNGAATLIVPFGMHLRGRFAHPAPHRFHRLIHRLAS